MQPFTLLSKAAARAAAIAPNTLYSTIENDLILKLTEKRGHAACLSGIETCRPFI